ncbi:hypothetical protein KBD68_03065 [Candidatus Woesebacteria bacterium]|nr:hypothetical protein [Candidatus Woesebacteria bacterium]
MTVKPQIVFQNYEGVHNTDLDVTNNRLETQKFYKDLSTICIIPTRGMISAKVVQNWWSLMTPMNQKFIRVFMIGMEVGAAYSAAIEQILANPVLSEWKYILTLEEDNMPPPDGLLKLYENMDKFDVIGGLYWTKGDQGQPMIYGDPHSIPLNFMPQLPIPETVQHCNGLGMGFNLFKMEIFKDRRVPKPWFKTVQEYTPGVGMRGYTQDLYFYENIHKLGYKVACDTRVKVGHYDFENDIVW